MGLLKKVWNKLGDVYDEGQQIDYNDEDNGVDIDSYYSQRNTLPYGTVRLGWQGYYYDYAGLSRWGETEGIFELGLARRMMNNENDSAVHWLKKSIPDFCEPQSPPYPHAIESNY